MSNIEYIFNIFFKAILAEYTLLIRKISLAGIPRYYTKKFVIRNELVRAFFIYVYYHKLLYIFRVVSRNNH